MPQLLLGVVPYSSWKHIGSIPRAHERGEHPFSKLEEQAKQVGSEEVWAVMGECWNLARELRPNIFELKIRLNALCM
jgi:hypothetical protein